MGKLLQHIRDEIASGSSDYTSPNTDAGMAFSRLTAVYPGLTTQTIPASNRNVLIENTEVQKILGRTIALADVSARGLSDQMLAYMGRNPQAKDANEMNPWPLIKVVRVFTKASALSTGAVIVDLPGVQDSNAARAAVSSNYAKDCSALWVVVPIMRAVDDKSAKDLMGESFRYQMLLDDKYSAVSFICSKTDDINIDEAAGELDLTVDIGRDIAKVASLTREIPALETDLKALQERNSKDRDTLDECRDESEDLETTLRHIQGGQAIHAAIVNLGKRERTIGAISDMHPSSTHPTEDQVRQRLHALRAKTQGLRDRVRIATEKRKEQEQNLELKLQERKLLQESIKESCIQKRNVTSTQSIRQDFADGIRDLDEANTADQSDVFFNPDQPRRDYNKIKTGLPVFCISSRAYQKLKGMMQNEDFNTSGYRSLDDTGIPGLQAHAQKLTESNRNARCRQILTKLWSLLTSIACWITGNDIIRAGFDATTVEKHLQGEANKLRVFNIYSKLDALVSNAAANATHRAAAWFAHHKAGGFSPATFKAICRKEGKHVMGGRPEIDLNQELFKPILSGIHRDWDTVFGNQIPVIFQEFLAEVGRHQQEFHQSVVKKYEANGSMAMALDLLNSVNGAGSSKNRASPLWLEINKAVESRKSKAFGKAVSPIAEAMKVIYRDCLLITLVKTHIEDIGRTVFRESARKLHEHLRDMDRYVTRRLEAGMDEIHEDVYRDYSNALLAGNQKVKLSPVELKLKTELTTILNSVNPRFRTKE
ncbi:nuclear GTPase SLIP-GC [Colletotrichum liriopes]|uniref:Nuclear GTPase SLIP-GC n=1 Tax=Colletotrichum liriopes TaxID=708192 RepID=A0AA37LUX0_9PEZI|nr:nuclear GTPase SLIP-GC [Colletotrichum liriopes]